MPMHSMLNGKMHVCQRSLGGLAGLQVDCEAMKQALPETTVCVVRWEGGRGGKRPVHVAIIWRPP